MGPLLKLKKESVDLFLYWQKTNRMQLRWQNDVLLY